VTQKGCLLFWPVKNMFGWWICSSTSPHGRWAKKLISDPDYTATHWIYNIKKNVLGLDCKWHEQNRQIRNNHQHTIHDCDFKILISGRCKYCPVLVRQANTSINLLIRGRKGQEMMHPLITVSTFLSLRLCYDTVGSYRHILSFKWCNPAFNVVYECMWCF